MTLNLESVTSDAADADSAAAAVTAAVTGPVTSVTPVTPVTPVRADLPTKGSTDIQSDPESGFSAAAAAAAAAATSAADTNTGAEVDAETEAGGDTGTDSNPKSNDKLSPKIISETNAKSNVNSSLQTSSRATSTTDPITPLPLPVTDHLNGGQNGDAGPAAVNPNGGTASQTPATAAAAAAELISAQLLTNEDFIACYNMVRKLRGLYIASGLGWNAKDKKAEMRYTPGMQFLVIRSPATSTPITSSPVTPNTDTAPAVTAFASFVLDDHLNEDGTGDRVTYLYELHVSPTNQGSGYGRQLINEIRRLSTLKTGSPLPIALTVINANHKARAFYRHLGFTPIANDDEPPAKRSRTGWHQLRLE
ncbi:histone N-acetyltransferase (predicted) [Sugiyamaella lignohabitans]|uniref:N-alpha-acetyltransferase 40 n=1 Tax=Sugiyamaella lignohabitans TaxID=796027 RepID=A0A167CPU2_9ASCO|nr:histone N-acetyltransferase (predicted) [Sugiyamaella lignohabitans]ANB11963.1 histone N-acetyltransferase (predicted) [Sugiyamaella lignohabitans]